MDTIFINSENSRTPMMHILTLKLANKLDLRFGEKVIALSNVSIYYTWKNIKSAYNNNKFKTSSPTWNDKFKLPDGSYSIPDIIIIIIIILFRIILNIYLKNMEKLLINHQSRYM